MDKSIIRNFCIIAHIDHGKSTLADRIIEIPMWLVVFADVGVMVIAVINAMRNMIKVKV